MRAHILRGLLLAALAQMRLGQYRARLLKVADRAYLKTDYATALRLFRSLADHGNAYAQYTLGLMYEMGQGVPSNIAEALKWFYLAAEHGNAHAQYTQERWRRVLGE